MSPDRQRERHKRNQRKLLQETHYARNTTWHANPLLRRTIADGWAEYAVLLPDHPVVRGEGRRAFYAGAFELMESMKRTAAEVADNELLGAVMYEARRQELEAFDEGFVVDARVREGPADQPGLREGWESYERTVLDPENMGAEQREFTREAFYAGARAMSRCVEAVGEPTVSEEEGDAFLEARANEIVRFYQDVGAGRA